MKPRNRKSKPRPARADQPLRVLVCDDQQLVRVCLRKLFNRVRKVQIIGEAATGRQAVALAIQLKPDIVLMDVSMPVLNGIEATRQILAKSPGIRVLGFSFASDPKTVGEMLAAGARGYLLKTNDPVELIVAFQKVLAGRKFIQESDMSYRPRPD